MFIIIKACSEYLRGSKMLSLPGMIRRYLLKGFSTVLRQIEEWHSRQMKQRQDIIEVYDT